MKKVATITFHNAKNVGAVLQAYALQKSIERIGAKSEIIDYRNVHIDRAHAALRYPVASAAGMLKSVALFPFRAVKNYRFRVFSSRYMNVTRGPLSPSDMESIDDRYDVFIVGSDQVWGYSHTGGIDTRYFLDFVSDRKKRKSYAASFGFETIPAEYSDEYAKLLKRFSSLSLREPSAARQVREMTGLGAQVSLDPVFLISSREWRAFAKLPGRVSRGGYVLVFAVNGVTDKIVAEAKRVAQSQGLKRVVCLSRVPRFIKGVTVVWDFHPRAFLGYISEAGYVITDSFHATAFSIIFKKDFVLSVASQHGNINNRSLELMGSLGLSDRVLGGANSAIDWTAVGGSVDKAYDSSLAYLESCIG